MAVDLLDYMRGDGRAYQVRFAVDGTSGTQTYQTQTDSADSNLFYQVKNKTWERIYFDDTYIYREADTGESAEHYYVQTTNGQRGAVWSKRFLDVGDFTDRNPLVIHYHKHDCSERLRTNTPSTLTLLDIKSQHTFPTGVTLNDVIVLGWSVKDNMLEEKLYYAKNKGLVGWENINRGSIFIAPSSLNGHQLQREEIACLPSNTPLFYQPPAVTHVRVKPTGDAGLNIRTQPRVAANNLITTVKAGTVLRVIKQNPIWWEVELLSAETFTNASVTGFAYGAFLESAEPEKPVSKVTASGKLPNALFLQVKPVDFLNARTRPRDFDNTIIAALKTGAVIEFIARDGDWFEVILARGSQFVSGVLTGFVHSDFVAFMDSQFSQTVRDITTQLRTHPTKRYSTRRLDQLEVHAVHHTAVDRTVSVDRIAEFHVNSRNWPGIGYTFFIEANGTILQTNALTTLSYATGNENHRVLSTVLAGSFVNGNQPTVAQIEALRWLHHVYIVRVLGRKLPLKGHQEVRGQVTACPGNSWDWQTLIGEQSVTLA